MRNFAPYLVLLLILGCAAPRHKLYGDQVFPVESLEDVLQCAYKGNITAVVKPAATFPFRGWDHAANMDIAIELNTDARNRAQDVGGNRILAHDYLYKGTRSYMVFNCPKPTRLDAYYENINADTNSKLNLQRLCRNPGPAQCADYNLLCERAGQNDLVSKAAAVGINAPPIYCN